MLKHVAHDWDDEKFGLLLRNIRAAMKPSGRLLIIDIVLPEKGLQPPAASMDIQMLLALSAYERSEASFRHVLVSNGFNLNRIIPIGQLSSIVEAYQA